MSAKVEEEQPGDRRGLTRYDVARIHRVLVLDKPESIHELDLGNLSGSMGRKMGFKITLGG